MASIGFKGDSNLDIETKNGLFVFEYNEYEVADRVRHELSTIQGEIKDEPLRGLNVFGIMLARSSTKAQRKAEIIRALSYIPEVTVNNIVENQEQRVLKYYINITYNEITRTIEFGIQ